MGIIKNWLRKRDEAVLRKKALAYVAKEAPKPVLPTDTSEITSVTGMYQLAGKQLDEATRVKKDARSAAQRLLDMLHGEKKDP